MASAYDGMPIGMLISIYRQMEEMLRNDPADAFADQTMQAVYAVLQAKGEDPDSLHNLSMGGAPPPPTEAYQYKKSGSTMGPPLSPGTNNYGATGPGGPKTPALTGQAPIVPQGSGPPSGSSLNPYPLAGTAPPGPPPAPVAQPPLNPYPVQGSSNYFVPTTRGAPPEAPYPYGAPGTQPKNGSFDMTNLLPPFRPAGGVGEGLGAMSASPSVGGVGKAVGGAVESLGKILGPEVEQIGKFITAIAGASDAVRDWIKGLHNANMEFAEFSGAMADVKSQQQNREIELAMQRGDRRADSAAELADAMHEMNREFARAEDAIAKDLNKIGAQLASILEVCMNIFNFIFQVDEDEKTADQGQTMAELHRMAGENDAPEKFGMPKWAR